MTNINIEALYDELTSQDRELVRISYDFDANSQFASNGQIISNQEANVSIQHGIALQSLANLRHAYNQAVNAFGVLNSRVENVAIKKSLGIQV